MTELALFCGSFAIVFALGFQQQNIHCHRYVLGMLNATFIGVLNLLMLKLGPQASPTDMLAFIAGEPFGTVAAIWLNSRWHKTGLKQSLSDQVETLPTRHCTSRCEAILRSHYGMKIQGDKHDNDR